MELDELHIVDGRPRTVGKGCAVSGLDPGIAGKGIDLPDASGAEDYGLGSEDMKGPLPYIKGQDSPDLSIIYKESGDKPLVISFQIVIFQRGLKEGVEEVKAGLVCGMERALLAHSAAPAHGDVPVFLTVPGTTPPFYLDHLFAGIPDKGLYGILVCQKVAPLDRIKGMEIMVVVVFDYRGASPLCGDGVASHGVNLGDDGGFQGRIGVRNGNAGAKACAAAPNNQDVMG